jgi:ABC-type multidrug transport system fused ATPase/permease subunit
MLTSSPWRPAACRVSQLAGPADLLVGLIPIDAARGMAMPMLKIEDITYSVEGRPLFEGASATIPTGHKVGLVGRNGAGKTTLFRLIRGELALEGGAITLPQRARIGGVAQEVPSSAPRCWTRCWPPIPNAPA